MNKKYVLVFLFLLSAFMPVRADVIEITGKIYRLYATGESLYVRLKEDTCVTGNGYYRFVLNTDYTQYISSILLAAANADKAVTIAVEACPLESERVDALYLSQDME